jgi:hypothetical protein
LAYLPNIINPKLPKKLGFQLKTFPASCAILTPSGLFHAKNLDSSKCFGDNIRTQLVSLTICALAHFFDGEFAISIFIRCVIPALLTNQSRHRVKEAFNLQLTDNISRILNERAAYRLPARFEDAIRRLDLPHPLHDLKKSQNADQAFVGGLLKWIVQSKRRHYITCSATVARIASCLDEVGWNISTIRVWNQSHPIPPAFDGVTLVTAESFDTDPLMLVKDELRDLDIPHTHHYTNNTVGSMIYVAMRAPEGISPEALQSEFDCINRSIMSRLKFV